MTEFSIRKIWSYLV